MCCVQLLLGSLHDYGALGQPLQWPLAILGAVLVMRTCTAPLLVMQMKSTYNMSKAKPMMEQLQAQMVAKIQRGENVMEAQVCFVVVS